MYFKAIPVTERLPELGKWVTTIDAAGEHRVYRLVEFTDSVGLSWNMRDSAGDHSPNDNLPITHWLELCDDTMLPFAESMKDYIQAVKEVSAIPDDGVDDHF